MKQSKYEVLHKWDTKPERRVKGLKEDIDSGRNLLPTAKRIAWIVGALDPKVGSVLDVGAGSGHLVYALE